MRKFLHKILVTGGAGFIGSAFVRLLLTRDCPQAVRGLSPLKLNKGTVSDFYFQSKKGLPPNYKVIVVDKLTYAGDLERLRDVKGRYKFYQADICNKKQIDSIFTKERPQILVNFAAETHVDRSIKDASTFVKTNINGIKVLLDTCREYKIKKFIQISTDEVYGEIRKGKFTEQSPLKPNSPYAASKAAADLLIRSYIRTYGFPAIIIRPCNNYGPWQYPEKLIPVIIYKALNNEKVPVYAQGLNAREWLYVSDCAEAICSVLEKAKTGKIYNLGSGYEKKNIDTVKKILDVLDKPYRLIQFVKDRPGHDYRYSLGFSKIRKLGWKPKIDFETGIIETVNWYKQNLVWLEFKVKYLRGYWKKVYKE